jgi:hypothetical protein
MICKHDNVVFNGMYSLVGNYLCKDCDIEIDPVEYAKMKGMLNIALLDYYEENPDKLDPMFHDHPWVAHLYEVVDNKTLKEREEALDELTKQAQDLDMGY